MLWEIIKILNIILTAVPSIFYYFVQWPTNAQLFHKLSHCYMFQHYRVILSELVVSTLPSYTSISNAAVGHHHHHQVILLLVEYRAAMNSFQALRSPAIPLTSFHDLVLLILSSTVLRHVLFGLPLLLYPWGFQSNAVFSIAAAFLRNVCPIQFHFLHFIWFSINFCRVILRSSSFVNLSVHFILIIHLNSCW